MNPSPLQLLSRNWGLVLFRGILAILFGIMAFAWPLLTLAVLVILYGAYVLVDGILALVVAIKGGTPAPRGWLIFVGILGIAAGLAVMFWPGLSALALLLFIGVTAVVRGLFEIIGAIALRKEINDEWFHVLSGIVSIAFGLVMIFFPGGGAIAMIWVIAFYAIAFGILLTILAFRLRKHARANV
jgi:uncharacterized membrane protein HdeD (DUF308 family)